MNDRVGWIDTGGGHILVALFIFVVGVVLVACNVPKGEDVIVGALGSLYTSLRSTQRDQAAR